MDNNRLDPMDEYDLQKQPVAGPRGLVIGAIVAACMWGLISAVIWLFKS